MRFSPEGKTPGKNWPPRKEEVYDTPQEWLRRIGGARVQRERESNARNDLHADSDRRVESPKASIPLGIGLVWTQISRASLTVIILRYEIEKRLRAV